MMFREKQQNDFEINRPRSLFPPVNAVTNLDDAPSALDVLFINPPLPGQSGSGDPVPGAQSAYWMADVARPQVSLAQMAAMLVPDYNVRVIDALAQRLSWATVEINLRRWQPRYYVTQIRPETCHNDIWRAMLAHKLGARTILFGRHLSAEAAAIIETYPDIDFVIYGEAELTLRELVDTLEIGAGRRTAAQFEPSGWSRLQNLFKATNPAWQPAWHLTADPDEQVSHVQGLAWRCRGEPRINPARLPVPNLDDLPLAHHHLLPLDRYRLPMSKRPYTYVVTGRNGAGLDQADQSPTVRLRTPGNILAELWLLHDSGIHDVHLLTDGVKLDRAQIMAICKMIIEEELPLRWSCTTRINDVDAELLAAMGRAGCRQIFWKIESVTEQILNGTAPPYRSMQVPQTLRLAKKAGIQNWGYFTLGRPGETEARIRETIAFAKALPLDMVFFQPAPTQNSSVFDLRPAANGTDPALDPEALRRWCYHAFQEWAWHTRPFWSMMNNLKVWARFRHSREAASSPLGWAVG